MWEPRAWAQLDLGPPPERHPRCGRLAVSVEVSPTASPYFRGRIGEQAGADLAGVLGRALAGGGTGAGAALDMETLCIKGGGPMVHPVSCMLVRPLAFGGRAGLLPPLFAALSGKGLLEGTAGGAEWCGARPPPCGRARAFPAIPRAARSNQPCEGRARVSRAPAPQCGPALNNPGTDPSVFRHFALRCVL